MKYNITLNGKIYEVDVTESDAVVTGITQVPVYAAAPAATAPAAPVPAPSPAPGVSADGVKIQAPMPGSVVAVKKSVGESVTAGETVIVLEAMKMENEIVAPCDGTVKAVVAPKGATVNTDDVLMII